MEWLWSKIGPWVEDPGIDKFEGLDMGKLDMDQAYVVAETTLDNIRLYAVSDDCYRCPYELLHKTSRSAPEPWVLATAQGVSWRLVEGSAARFIHTEHRSGLVCEMRPELGEFGVYHLNITSDNCLLTTSSEPVNIHLPLLLAAMVLGGLVVLSWALRLLVACAREIRPKKPEIASDQRLRSLDTFRGMMIILMIFVNCGGGHYQQMTHATWNGLHVADLVFPSFVWIMGFCIPLSAKGVLSKGVPRWKALLHILKRSFLMFFVGVCLHTVFGDNYLATMRVMGVLQRLAIAYLLVATFYLFTASSSGAGGRTRAVCSVAWWWVLAASLLAVHTYVTFLVHNPNCPRGYLGPGGRHDNWAASGACAGGAAGYVDRLILGEHHIYQELSTAIVYGSSSMEPENLLGSLTTAAHAVLGAQAGAALRRPGHRARLARWLAWAAAQALAGGALAGFSREGGIVPINKNLWSISFVLLLSGLSAFFFCVCYLLTDVWRVWSGFPFLAPGRNAIFLFVAHNLCDFMFPFRWRVTRMRTHAIFLLENIWATALWLVVAHVMARRKIFLTL